MKLENQTLPVSTATSERAFSAMKIVKTQLRNTMNDDFLKNCLHVNIEKEIADTFSTDMVIDDFYSMKQRRRLNLQAVFNSSGGAESSANPLSTHAEYPPAIFFTFFIVDNKYGTEGVY
ncbi:hypothetical protein LXL04_029179 [Taraxacum kok-saghyz]